MSYTRRYKERISVRYSGSVSYPASQSGGTKSYSGTVYEDVNVVIEVDTRPFDNSVEGANKNINLLTGAVVATEAAQIASKKKNSEKVAKAIVNGFFTYIRSEISQQISELRQSIDSQLMHLRELSKSLIDKKRQMEVDFMRIASRYTKIFDDLNNELSNRIHELDKPTFIFKRQLDDQHIRTNHNDLVNTVAVFGREGGEVQTKISASIAKKRAYDTLMKVRVFLWQQKYLDATVDRSMLKENVEVRHFAPVCYIETRGELNQMSRNVRVPDYIESFREKKRNETLVQEFNAATVSWKTISPEERENIKPHFTVEVNRAYPRSDPHTGRIKDMIYKLLNQDDINIIGH